jgi:quercetin dioxygenase-like cupin family protein
MKMTTRILTTRFAVLLAVLVAMSQAVPVSTWAGPAGGHDDVVLSEPLHNVPGSQLTAVVVNLRAGAKSAKHHHAGSVFAYVPVQYVPKNPQPDLCGCIAPANPSFEPAGSVHLISENASTTEPASLLAVFVAEAGAQLTTPDK